MNKTGIEYLDYTWNFQTGCLNQENGVCTLPCWAKAMAHRFGRSFKPTFQRTAFIQKMPENARIGVCFTGDLFGDWVNLDMLLTPYTTLKDGVLLKVECERQRYNQFFFLTKCPRNLQKWGEFPDNAWVGTSVCNDVMLTNAFRPMQEVKAKNKWLSIEPLLSWDMSLDDTAWTLEKIGIKWLVIGGQTHPTKLPEKAWVDGIVAAADRAGIPIWLKNNLKPLMGENLRQELP